jgi:hypothetical protein
VSLQTTCSCAGSDVGVGGGNAAFAAAAAAAHLLSETFKKFDVGYCMLDRCSWQKQ